MWKKHIYFLAADSVVESQLHHSPWFKGKSECFIPLALLNNFKVVWAEFLLSDTMFSPCSGIIDNAGGKILVQKVAGHSGYRGSFSNGVRSLSLPRWRESFLVSGTVVERRSRQPTLALPTAQPARQQWESGK